jgi:hypothetical protein
MSPDQQQQNPYNQAPQQHSNGQYEVVPPIPANAPSSSTGHNPYEFIFAAQPKKRGLSLSLGNDRKSMLIWLGILAGGAAVVLILVGVVLSALAPKGSTAGLTAIAQRQQEIIRIADAAAHKATSQDVLNFVTNTDLGVSTNQRQVITYLSAHGTKLKPLVLNLDKDTQTDTVLTNAASINTYDAAVVQNLRGQLQAYEILLQNTAKQSSNRQTRALLQQCFTAADKLLQQAKAADTSS